MQMQKNTPSSPVHMEHSPLDCILGHKSNLSKFNKIEIISSTFADHSPVSIKKTVKNTNTLILSNMFLNNQKVTEEIKWEIKKNF